MSHYRGPRFKKIHCLGALPGLTSKNPRTGNNLRNQLRPGKKSQYRIRLEGKKIAHILVNGGIVDIPSYRCKPRDIIIVRDEQKSRALIQNYLDSFSHEELPKHLTLHPFQYKGLVNQIIDSKWVALKINELLVVEYYSRQT
ncbi:hypothetical protein UlMin_034750 [Ulmus minor]